MPKKINNKKEPSEIAKVHFLNNQIGKNVEYIGYADLRAQGIITINAFLIPIVVVGMGNPDLRAGIFIVVITAMLTVFTAVMALYPRHYTHHDANIRPDIFHFVQLKNMSEEEFLASLSRSLNDQSLLFEDLSRDLYHVAKLIVAPKFKWIKRSYLIFTIGNFIAIAVIFLKLS